MNDVPSITSIKTKKRIRSLFTPEQSKLVRTKVLPPISNDNDMMIKPEKSKLSAEDSGTTLRFKVDISCDRDNGKYPEIYFSDLVDNEKEENEEEDDPEIRRMAEYFENKYGGDNTHMTDVHIDHGYDTSDPFVDDSEAFDEVIPDELDTQHGGFYVNFGELMFKKVPNSLDNAQNKKRKRDEDDRKTLHKKMKSMKIKEKYKKLEKDVKKKKKKVLIEDISSDNSSHTAVTKERKLSTDPAPEIDLSDISSEREDMPDRPKKTPKIPEPSADEPIKKSEPCKPKPKKDKNKASKKNSKERMNDRIQDVLDVVKANSPFGETKLHLISVQLAGIEYEVRKSHTVSRRSIYEGLITKMECLVDYQKLKNAGFSALTKQNAENLNTAFVPLKEAIQLKMAKLLSSFAAKREAYLTRLKAWKLAQEGVAEELAKPKCPVRQFKWDDNTRELFGRLIVIKFAQVRLLRVKTHEQDDLMRRYLTSLQECLWQEGWMLPTVLLKEAQPFCKALCKNKAKPQLQKKDALSTKVNPLKPCKAANLLKNAVNKQLLANQSASPSSACSETIPQTSKSETSNSINKPGTTTPKPKPAQNCPKSAKKSADIAIIREHVSKISANISKQESRVPITITDDTPRSSVIPPTIIPKSIPVLQIQQAKPKPNSLKLTDSDVFDSNLRGIRPNKFPMSNLIRPSKIVNTPVNIPSVGLISPRVVPVPIKPPPANTRTPPANARTHNTESTAAPPGFLQRVLKKYGQAKLGKLKEAGLLPQILAEELKLTHENDVIVIDDNDAVMTSSNLQKTTSSISPSKTSPSVKVTSTASVLVLQNHTQKIPPGINKIVSPVRPLPLIQNKISPKASFNIAHLQQSSVLSANIAQSASKPYGAKNTISPLRSILSQHPQLDSNVSISKNFLKSVSANIKSLADLNESKD